jgi:cytochrome c-type biogenesis protein CcmH/NrfF
MSEGLNQIIGDWSLNVIGMNLNIPRWPDRLCLTWMSPRACLLLGGMLWWSPPRKSECFYPPLISEELVKRGSQNHPVSHLQA